MMIDFMTPLWGGLAAGIILSTIIGVVRFVAVSIEKKAIEKKFLNLISELESLQKSHKNEIARIKDANLEVIKSVIAQNTENTEKLLEKYHRLVPPAKLAFLEEWDNILLLKYSPQYPRDTTHKQNRHQCKDIADS